MRSVCLCRHWSAPRLAVARDDRATAADLVMRSWGRGADENNVLWQLLAGADHLRVATQLGDDQLAERSRRPRCPRHRSGSCAGPYGGVRRGVASAATSPLPSSPWTTVVNAPVGTKPPAATETALCSPPSPATRRRRAGCWPTPSTSSTRSGRRRRPVRFTARLRTFGVRLGARGARGRPKVGWPSLTPTEARIVELVAERLNRAADRPDDVHLAPHGADPRLQRPRQARPDQPPAARRRLHPTNQLISAH